MILKDALKLRSLIISSNNLMENALSFLETTKDDSNAYRLGMEMFETPLSSYKTFIKKASEEGIKFPEEEFTFDRIKNKYDQITGRE
ncbi:MAG: hypothetical protein ABH967_02230 [Patescibacteria group bacterium]